MFKFFLLFFSLIFLSNFIYANEPIKCNSVDSYKNIDTNLKGIELWINSVKNVNKCDDEQIIYLSNNRSINIILSSITTLKAKYNYCEQVLNIDKNFKNYHKKILKLKKELNNCSKTKKMLDLENELKKISEKKINIYNKLNKNSQKIKDLKNKSINLNIEVKNLSKHFKLIKEELIKEELRLKESDD